MTHKVTLLADDLWIIESRRTKPDKSVVVQYYETPSTWNCAPNKATIFTSFEAAEAHLIMLRNRDMKGVIGWADGSTEEFNIVSLYTEILMSPNAKVFKLP